MAGPPKRCRAGLTYPPNLLLKGPDRAQSNLDIVPLLRINNSPVSQLMKLGVVDG